jgi:hypothetical protein
MKTVIACKKLIFHFGKIEKSIHNEFIFEEHQLKSSSLPDNYDLNIMFYVIIHQRNNVFLLYDTI